MNQAIISRLMEWHGWTLAQAEDFLASEQQRHHDEAKQCSDFDNE